MAFDLDDDELEATRKMHKGSDINVGNIEKDIKILNNYLKNSAYKESNSDFFKNGGWEIVDLEVPQALEHLLLDYTRQKQINEEHQKINGELKEKVKELEEETLLISPYYVKQNYIPKRKVEDELETLRKMLKATMSGKLQEYTAEEIIIKINTLEELLEGE